MPVAENVASITLDRIMIATDFEPAAEAATAYAASLARHFSSALTVAHVIDLSLAAHSEAAMAGWPLEQVRHDSAENMDRVVHQLNSLGIDVRSRGIEAHTPAAAIVGLSELLDSNLIVMGASSRHGLSKLLVGSIAAGVIHHAKCPVLTLGPNAKISAQKEFRLHTVIFATDLLHHAAEKAATALAFAKESLAKVYICHVLDESAATGPGMIDLETEAELALLKLVPVSAYEWSNMEYVVQSGKAGENIVELAKKLGADLVVLGARPSALYRPHLSKSVVEHVIAEAECPVMTICMD
jgi:nucleotide-binding universal stress UspA family protein